MNKNFLDIYSVNAGVTPSRTLLTYTREDGRVNRYFIDCGIQQGSEDKLEEVCNNFLPNTINGIGYEDSDGLFITHAHMDHFGNVASTKGNVDIFCSRGTKTLAKVMLQDGYKIMKDACREAKIDQLYNEKDIIETIKRMNAVDEYQEFYLDADIRALTYPNNHLVGSVMYEINCESFAGTEQDINVLITGDYAENNVFCHNKKLPKELREKPLNIIIESTYGDTETKDIEKGVLKNAITEFFNNNTDGTIIIPVFALQRMQQILLELSTMPSLNKVDIYLDGTLGKKITEIFIKRGDALSIRKEVQRRLAKFVKEKVKIVDRITRRVLLNEDLKGKKIIVTTSGMVNAGPAQSYLSAFGINLKNKTTNSRVAVFFPGYLAPITYGAKIHEFLEERGMPTIQTLEYSSHAKADELEAFLEQFENILTILITHGDEETREKFLNRIMSNDKIKAKRVEILQPNTTYRFTDEGLISILPD